MSRSRVVVVIASALALALPAAAQAAPPTPQPYQTNDALGFRDVLPPGTNGLANGPQLLSFLTSGTRPAHNDDQRDMYANLVYAVPGLQAQDLPKYFKDSSFGVKPEDVDRTYSPRGDVTIVRDKQFGVPHIYGSTRAGAMFGEGYAAAEDRLFFIDVLRHLGRAQLTSFAGGAEGNREFEREQWAVAPYTEQDLQTQVDRFPQLYGAEGQQVRDDLDNYVAGINEYIDEAKLNPLKMPGEYAAIGQPTGPTPWKPTDIVATASLVGGIFGKGGGGELQQAQILQSFTSKFGGSLGQKLWSNFRSAEDPEAPTTVLGKSFPYEVPPKKVAKGSVAMPDQGSVTPEPIEKPGGGGLGGLFPARSLPRSESNALVVSGAKSVSGHPLAVFGPQVGYFAPEILMEEDVHAPDLDARGASFPGVNLYVELGRGRDYSWSATSAGQDIIDEFAVPLCDPNGGPATKQSTGYVFRGQCLPIETLTRTNSWTPNAADQTPPGSETLTAERTKLGLVIARATIKGKPVAYTQLRTTYMHEVDSARGFRDFNTPSKMRSPQDFQRAASKIGYTFNWLYVDAQNDAYFNSGNNPVRAKNTDPLLPVDGKFEWKGFNPDLNTAAYTPFSQHPQVINQQYITSWNNKQAPGYRAAGSGFTSVYRSQLLSDRVKKGIKGARKMTLVQLVNAMEDAGTVDIRGDKVLPYALQIIGLPKDPALATAVAKLRAWVKGGSHRRDLNRDGKYDDADAIQIMDAWWPKLIAGEFEPTLGSGLYKQLQGALGLDNAPNNGGAHLGSAYQDGWYGYASKDLRTILGQKVKGRYARVFCGKGKLAACRAMLLSTLAEALKVTPQQLYGNDSTCAKAGEAGSQTCFDKVSFRALGGVTQPLIPWVNRPTYQQVVEIQGSSPR